jgi:hypothetical protein
MLINSVTGYNKESNKYICKKNSTKMVALVANSYLFSYCCVPNELSNWEDQFPWL